MGFCRQRDIWVMALLEDDAPPHDLINAKILLEDALDVITHQWEKYIRFDKNLLFDVKSIRSEKYTVKGEKMAKGEGTKGVILRKRNYAGVDFSNRFPFEIWHF